MDAQTIFSADGPALFTLYEELEPPDAVAGELKTRNPPEDSFQRKVVTYRGQKSDFKVLVELAACVHGWRTPDHKEAMTLMVFDYELHYTKKNHFVDSVKTEFKFGEVDSSIKGQAGQVSPDPEVMAYAPFGTTKEWDESAADMEQKMSVNTSISGQFVGKADVGGSIDRKNQHEQKFFNRGEASRELNNRTNKWDRVYWFLQQNDSQQRGVPPSFTVAILLKRASMSRFQMTFDIRLDAGLWENMKSRTKRFFSRKEDDPVYFDPEKLPTGTKWEKFKRDIKQDNLGALMEGDKLTNLVSVWGVELGTFGPKGPQT